MQDGPNKIRLIRQIEVSIKH